MTTTPRPRLTFKTVADRRTIRLMHPDATFGLELIAHDEDDEIWHVNVVVDHEPSAAELSWFGEVCHWASRVAVTHGASRQQWEAVQAAIRKEVEG